jgi:hypothetical protein
MLVGCVVVDDGVDRLPRRNLSFDDIEEADELLMAMALHIATDHRAVEDVHRGEQLRRSVPLIVVCHRSGAALLQRQSGLRAVQRLNLALLIDRQDDGVRGRIDLEPDDIAQFVDETGIVGELELAHPVRLEAKLASDALNRADAEARRLRHQDACPVGRLARRFAKRQRNDALGAARLDARGTRFVAEPPVEPLLDKAFLPTPYPVLGLAGSLHDLGRADAIGRKQYHACFCGALRSRTRLLADKYRRMNPKGIFLRASRRLARRNPRGNPIRDSSVRFDQLAIAARKLLCESTGVPLLAKRNVAAHAGVSEAST